MDDFAVTEPPPPPAAAGASSRRTSKGSSVATSSDGKTRSKLCGFPACDEDCKTGRRHCSHHHRHLDNGRNQVVKAKGEEAAKAYMERCRDMEFANGQIAYMMKLSIGLPMFARAPLIDFVKWEQEFGVLVETKHGVQTQPFEEEQWIIRQVQKFGRPGEAMELEWKQKLAGPWKRDNLGKS